jgi:hypothetical protein
LTFYAGIPAITDQSGMAFQIPVAAEKRSRLSALQPPLWATWSLNAATESEWKSRIDKANDRLAGVLNKLSKNPKPPKKDSHWSKFSIRSMLQDGSDNAIHASDWKTYHEDEFTEVGRESDGHIDQDRIGSISLEVGKLQPLMTSVLEEPAEAIGSITPEMLEPGYFDYTPLLPVEQEQVQRFLRLTGYTPEQPRNQKTEHEIFRESYRQSLTAASKDFSQLEEESDPLEISKKFRQFQKKLDFYKLNEDVQGRQAFINMCKVAMPTRHTDWLLQKVYEDSQKSEKDSAISTELGEEIKRVADYKESVSAEEAIKMVQNGTMPFEKAAIVMHALATASNIRTKDIALSKQYIPEAIVGLRNRRINLERCRTESAALARIMKVLFPHFFQGQDDDAVNSTEMESSVKAALDTIHASKSTETGKTTKTSVNADLPVLQEESNTESNTDNPFELPKEPKRARKEDVRLRWEFRKRQIKLTQKLYDDLELQSNEDEQSESGNSEGTELDEDDAPFDGILDLQEWVESCHTKASYNKLKEHIYEMYDGEVPSWVEERLDPQFKMRLKIGAQEDSVDQGQLTNVEKEMRRRKEILKGLPQKLRRRKNPVLRQAKREAESMDRKEQKAGLMKRFEQEKAMIKEARKARLEQREKNRQQAEMERKVYNVTEKARRERLDCDRAIYEPRFTHAIRLKNETESDAEERLQKALEERAEKEIAYLEKTQAEINRFKTSLQSLKPSKRLKKRGFHQTNAEKERSRERKKERYNAARQKWLASLRKGSGDH